MNFSRICFFVEKSNLNFFFLCLTLVFAGSKSSRQILTTYFFQFTFDLLFLQVRIFIFIRIIFGQKRTFFTVLFLFGISVKKQISLFLLFFCENVKKEI